MLKVRKRIAKKGARSDDEPAVEEAPAFELPLDESLSPELKDKLQKAMDLAEVGQLEEALDIADQLVEEDPMNSHAWKLKGDLHTRLGDMEMAELCSL